MSFGDFRLHPSGQQLLHAGAPVPLGGRAFMILLALVEQAGELVSKETLIARVWPGLCIEDSTLRGHVAALRRALGRLGGARYIATVSGRGYRFVAPVSITWSGAPTAAAPDHNLTDRITPVVGREALIEELGARLADRRLTTLTGPGGIGKTTVALETARRQLGAHPDGVWSVDLGAITDPSLLPAAVASTLGLAVVSDAPTQVLIAFLKGKQMLLVLDSCEHVIDAAARLAEALLRCAPGVRLIATSREPLAAEGERVVRLAPLETPPVSAGLTAAEALAYPAVQLFVRAAAGPDAFALNDDDAPFVAEICRRLDGVALAIELCAGQIEAFGAQGLVSLVDEHLVMLMRGRRTALPRHQTLNATLEWSYRLLPDQERRLLRRLSVLVGAFTLDGALGVAADDALPTHAIPDLLAALVAKSLISAQVASPIPRYRLLETTRAYALRQLREAGEFAATARQHAGFVRKHLDAAGEALPCESRPCWAGNLRAALDWAHANDAEAALAITLGALPYWLGQGQIEACRVGIEQAIPLVEASPAGDADMMRLLGASQVVLMNRRGPGPELEQVSRRVLALAETTGDRQHQLRGLWGVWVTYSLSGRARAALEIARQFAEVAAQSPASAGVHTVTADRMLGISLHDLGDHAAAMRHLDRALATCPARSTVKLPYHFDQRILARSHRARVLLIQGCPDHAMREAAGAAEEARAIGHLPSLAYVLGEAACPLALATGDLDLAETFVDLLIEASQAPGLEAWRIKGRFYRGWLRSRRGDRAALPMLRESLAELRENRLAPLVTLAHAQAAASVGEPDAVREGLAAIDDALARAEHGGDRCFHPELLRAKAELLILQDSAGAVAAARDLLRAAAELAHSQGALSLERRAAMSLARIEGRSPWRPAARVTLA